MKTDQDTDHFSIKSNQICQKHVSFVQSIGDNPTPEQIEAIKLSQENMIKEMKEHFYSYINPEFYKSIKDKE